ncbi:hypothetical protein BDW59DRAFT_160996 [Aspergillus cavernicola]|uniref:Trypsin-like cysteine/serine peptidase domain-containing protein n=1 Tax=Aspergillus cavernicola TaxID=176166 RepID=A0ABR4IFD5_9EURO
MSMESTDEPSKWVCRLESYFDDGPFCGTGFVANIPETKKLCIFTAAHNIIRKGAGDLKKIRVTFPNKLVIDDVKPEECFASHIYKQNPTIDSTNANAVWDFGLISIDRAKHTIAQDMGPGGCAFNVWRTKQDLLANQVTVHGYREGKPGQTKGTSSLDRVDSHALYYYIDTIGGVSGGPIFSLDDDGNYVAVGIQYNNPPMPLLRKLKLTPSNSNYHSQGTRLTLRVMFEVLTWLDDYPLQRALQVRPPKTSPPKASPPKASPLYLQATKGTRPNIVARPSPAKIIFVVVDAPKSGPATGGRPHYSVLPASAMHYLSQSGLSFYMLALDESRLLVSFEKLATPGQKHVMSILGKKKTLALPNSKFPLTVFPSTRDSSCGCGCITQDQVVALKQGSGTSFLL